MRQEGGRDSLEAVDPPTCGPGGPAEAEDAGGHQQVGAGSLQAGEGGHLLGHVGPGHSRVNLLDDHVAVADLSPQARGEGRYEMLGGGVLTEEGHHVEA